MPNRVHDAQVSTAEHYQARLSLPYAPSAYQVAIWQWVETGRGSMVVEAVAGSGKSSTIKHAARLLAAGGLFLAFNKSIATELGRELPAGMVASTIHSHGYGAVLRGLKIRNRQPDGSKYRKMVRSVQDDARRGRLFGATLPQAAAQMMDQRPKAWPGDEIFSLINLARLDLLDPELPVGDFATEIDLLAQRHGIDWPGAFDGVVPLVVQRLMRQGRDSRDSVDFTDMIWLPVVLGLEPRRYPWIFVDECQDLSRCALALITASCKRGGRILFVGDRRQAIYAFAGADAESFARTLDHCKGQAMPLSVCYRCPTAALDLAREHCPQIEARPNAPQGVVRDLKAEDLPRDVHEGDMVLCRINAPLVSMCFRLIGEGVAAQVRGRSIGDGLIKAAREAEALAGTWDQFGRGIDDWATRQGEALERKISDEDRLADALDQLGDKIQCLRVVWARSAAKSLGELEAAIGDIFSDDRASVQLSSVHKAKGLEAQRVYILHPELLPSPRARTPEQMAQERNLLYVALTRCEQELIWVQAAQHDLAAPVGGLPGLGAHLRAHEPPTLQERRDPRRGLTRVGVQHEVPGAAVVPDDGAHDPEGLASPALAPGVAGLAPVGPGQRPPCGGGLALGAGDAEPHGPRRGPVALEPDRHPAVDQGHGVEDVPARALQLRGPQGPQIVRGDRHVPAAGPGAPALHVGPDLLDVHGPVRQRAAVLPQIPVPVVDLGRVGAVEDRRVHVVDVAQRLLPGA